MDCKPLPMLPYALEEEEEEMPLQKDQTLSSPSSSNATCKLLIWLSSTVATCTASHL